jgi:hypothetical protein
MIFLKLKKIYFEDFRKIFEYHANVNLFLT